MYRNKITIKLFLITFGMLALLVGIVILGQYFIVSRTYLTTKYTMRRTTDLTYRCDEIFYICKDKITNRNRKAEVTHVFNQYAKENDAYFLLLDSNYSIKFKSDNVGKLNSNYISFIQTKFKKGKIFSEPQSSFRINGFLNFPSKYIAVYCPEKFDGNTMENTSGSVYIVAVTKEVYTGHNYSRLQEYSIFLFIISVLLSTIFSIIFSFIVTRPILKIQDVTDRMTRLNFKEKCNYTSNDEIGKLSKNLNFLSDKLDDTIKQLKEANEKLKIDLNIQKEIDQLRKDFIAAVSHEFKTPLTLIKGFTEGINDDRIKKEEMQEARNIIIDEVDKMDELVQELLDLTRLESVTYELNMSEFDCIRLLKIISEKYKVIMKEHHINFHYELCDAVISVYADKVRIEQVVTNFINNAISNTSENGIVCLKSELQNDLLTVSIFNEGRHIENADIVKIWDKFYRADKSRNKATGGTGLGLAICKGILEKHESSYGVENVENGVRFYFMLKTIK